MKFTDRMVMDGGFRQTDDGWVVRGRVARGGNVQDYLASELGDEAKATGKNVIRVFRPEGEVFDRKAFATYARKPITMGHPSDGVSSETWKDLAVGEIDRDIVRDGEFVSVPLLFRDAKTVEALQKDGAPRELSMGYDAAVVFADGLTPSGEAYDAIMGGFKMNHVAVVQHARAGHGARFGDATIDGGKDREPWGASPVTAADQKEPDMPDVHLHTVVLGDRAVKVADTDAPIIESFKADAAAKLGDAEKKHGEAIAAKDKELAEKDAKIADLEKKVLDDAALDKRVQDRAALISKATAIVKDVKTEGVSDADIRKAVVIAKRGEDKIAGKSDDYIDAAFELLTDDDGETRTDPVHDALRTQARTAVNDAWSDGVFKSAGVSMKKEA